MAQEAHSSFRKYGYWRRHIGSVMIWLAAVVFLVWLFENRFPRVEMVGIAHSDARQIASITTSRISILSVQPFEHVRTGQTVAVLNDDRIQAQLATSAAIVRQLRADLIAAEDRLLQEKTLLANDRFVDARRFAVDLENIRISLLELKTIQESDRIALAGVEERLKLTERLVAGKVATPFELLLVQNEYDVLSEKIKHNEKVLEQLKQDHLEALDRQIYLSDLPTEVASIDKALNPLREAIEVEQRRIAELSVDRAVLVLVSPIDGQVTQMLRRAGETVIAGEPIMSIVAQETTEIIAYAEDSQIDQIKEGMAVEFFTRNNPARIAASTITHIGPSVEIMPERLWPSPTAPKWGLPVKIAISGELDITPGELVAIRN